MAKAEETLIRLPSETGIALAFEITRKFWRPLRQIASTAKANDALLRTNADLTVDFRKFFTELGRHRVSTATVIHAVTNWRRLIQIAPFVLPFFDTPNQVVHLVMTRIGSGTRPLESLS